MTLQEAVAKACQEPTLVDALVWIAMWENDRAVHQALRNTESGQRDPNGRLWDTLFRRCFEEVLKQYKITILDQRIQ